MIEFSGYVDLQCNGSYGIDLTTEPERVWELAALLAAHGVTAWCPTVVTCPPERLDRLAATLRAGSPADGVPRARVIGAHLEGPMLNPRRSGAHPRRWLREPSHEVVDGWDRDWVALVTLAPELPGACDVIAELRRRGIAVSAGHTTATGVEACSSSLDSVTHLFNAMAPLGHRDPGTVGWVLDGGVPRAGLIADGVHVAPHALRLAWRCLGPDRLYLVSDAVDSAGRRPVDEPPRLSDGTLAGSSLTLDAAVRIFVDHVGCRAGEAVAMASTVPSAVVGWKAAPGDVVRLDADLRVVDVTIGGQRVDPAAHLTDRR